MRTLEEINRDATLLCAEIGNCKWRIKSDTERIEHNLIKLDQIIKERDELTEHLENGKVKP